MTLMLPSSDELDNTGFECVELSAEEIQAEITNAAERKMWHLKSIGVYDAWDYLKEKLIAERIDAEEAEKVSKGKGANIIIINSGVNYHHPDISERFNPSLKGYNFVDLTDDPMDLEGHGTSVAGVIAGKLGGVASCATLFSLRVGHGYALTLLKINSALQWCIDNKHNLDIDIINLSLSGTEYNSELETLCNKVSDAGILLVASAGNVSQGITFPSAFDDVLSVGAVDKSYMRYKKSAIAPTVNISAPGCAVCTAAIVKKKDRYENLYALATGTSISAPIVTGSLALAVAYLKFAGIACMTTNLRELLQESAQPLNDDLHAQSLIRDYRLSKYDSTITAQKALQWAYGSGIVKVDKFVKEVTFLHPK